MVQYFKLVGLALLLSVGAGNVGKAASFDCDKPILFSSNYQQSAEGINLYLSDWFVYEECMFNNIDKIRGFLEFREYLNELYTYAPDYTVAFNEWDTEIISEGDYYDNKDLCNEKNLVKLDKLLYAIWDHIKHLSGGEIPKYLLIQQRAWLSSYKLSCHNNDDHPYSRNQSSFCKQQEYEFRILSLSRYIGEGGSSGWPAKNINDLLNHFSIKE